MPGEPGWLHRAPWRRRAVLAALFSVATLLGRSAQLEGAHLAIFWPASAVGALWLAGSARRTGLAADAVLVVALTAVLRVLTGMPAAAALLLGAAAAVQALVFCWAYRRGPLDAFRLRTPADLWLLVLASVTGALVSLPLAVAGFAHVGGVPLGVAVAQWSLRTSVSTFVVLAVVVRALVPGTGTATPVVLPLGERLLMTVAVPAGYVLTFFVVRDVSLAFAVIPLGVWVALRRPTASATVHVAGAATVVVLSAWAGRGPWADLSPDLQAMSAQAFVGALGAVTLVLALHRDQSREHGEAAATAAAEVARAHDLLTSVLSAATEHAIVGVDTAGRITVFNEGAERMLGWDAETALGTDVRALLVREELQARVDTLGLADVDELFSSGVRERPNTERSTYVRADGSRLPVMLTNSPMRDDAGAVVGHILLATDLTARLAAEAELADSERLFRVAFAIAPVGMMMIGLQGADTRRVLRVNEAMVRFTGRSEEELLARTLHDLAPAADVADCRAAFDELLEERTRQVRCERTFEHADGRVLWAEMSATVLHPSGREPYLLCLVEDVTARRVAERDLQHRALHDALTGLANRRLFVERLEEAVTGCVPGEAVGVLYLDLDGFKAVNDTLGHAAGDELLRHVADLLARGVRPGDTVARLGGDEFAVVCTQASAAADAAAVGARLLQALTAPVALEAGEVRVGASIGVALGDATASPQGLLRAADAAMYEAKRAGKGRVVVRGEAVVGADV